MTSDFALGFKKYIADRDQLEQAKPVKERIISRHGHARINILSGAVRSGKTYVSLFYWILYILSRPANYEYLMSGRTLTTLKRNCFGLMQDFAPGIFSYSMSNKKAMLAGRTIWLEGANDDQAEKKIRGLTLSGAYIDEATLVPKDFFVMLLTRLSVEGARLYATTNPDAPTHWLKTVYIDNKKLDLRLTTLKIDDNPYLPADYISDAKKSY